MTPPHSERLLEKFRDVTQRRLGEIERALVALGVSGTHVDPELRRELARQLHTLKGEARMMGFEAVAETAHALEDRLGRALEGDRLSDPRFVDDVLAALDGVLDQIGARRSATVPVAPAPTADAGALAAIADRVTTLALGSGQLSTVIDELDAIAFELPRGLAGRLSLLATRAREHAREAESASMELLHRVRDLQLVPLLDGLAHYPRAVRDLGAQLGKRVVLQLDVGAVRIDREVLERLHDPLLHVLRNAVDHGCESPTERRAAGKSDTATIRIHAQRRGTDAVVAISDDGRGIDAASVAEAARRRGHTVSEQIGPQQALQLLFLPGMSTRTRVGDVSGRGVGLDVVRERVEALGGTVTLRSRPGESTTMELSVPVSSMLVHALAVRVGPCRCAVPLDAVVEVVAYDEARLVPIGDTVAFEHEGRLLPVRDLGDVVDATPRELEGHVLIVRRGADESAVVVDRVLGERQIVLRGKGEFLAGSQLVRDIGISTEGETTLLIDLAAIATAVPRRDRRVAAPPPPEDPTVVTRVVVADDSELTRDMLVRALRGRGLDVVEAVNGRDALAKIERCRPSIVFTDLDMPHLDGFGLMELLQTRDATDRPPVIVFSTHADAEHISRAKRMGAVGYLVKAQFDATRLDDLITRVLSPSSSPGPGPASS